MDMIKSIKSQEIKSSVISLLHFFTDNLYLNILKNSDLKVVYETSHQELKSIVDKHIESHVNFNTERSFKISDKMSYHTNNRELEKLAQWLDLMIDKTYEDSHPDIRSFYEKL
jgi:hypothetical protein